MVRGVTAFRAILAMFQGRFADAEALNQATKESGTAADLGPLSEQYDAHVRIMLHRFRGEFHEAEALVRAGIEAGKQDEWPMAYPQCLVHLGRLEAAKVDFERFHRAQAPMKDECDNLLAGLQGAGRTAAGERARQSVTRALKAAIDRIAAGHRESTSARPCGAASTPPTPRTPEAPSNGRPDRPP